MALPLIVEAVVVIAAEVAAAVLPLDTKESEKTHMTYRNLEIYSWALRSQLVIFKESDFICMKPEFT